MGECSTWGVMGECSTYGVWEDVSLGGHGGMLHMGVLLALHLEVLWAAPLRWSGVNAPSLFTISEIVVFWLPSGL